MSRRSGAATSIITTATAASTISGGISAAATRNMRTATYATSTGGTTTASQTPAVTPCAGATPVLGRVSSLDVALEKGVCISYPCDEDECGDVSQSPTTGGAEAVRVGGVAVGEHGDAGDYAASGSSSTSRSGYQRLNLRM